jgi:phage-related protein
MIYSIVVTNYLGDRIKLELGKPEVSGFLIKSITGLGPAKANVNTTEVSTNDGSLFNSARLSQRNIVLDMVFINTVYGESIEDLRQKSYKYFPLKKSVELTIETDNRYVKTTGYVESNEPNIFSSQEGTQISIICPDPYFYSAGEDGNNVTNFYSIDPMFEFPFSNESLDEPLLVFGEIQIKTEGVITYHGDSEIGVMIYIHAIGPATNINIYNTETREVMRINTEKISSLTGKGIVASDDIVINTAKGEKSITLIREGVSYNILNCLDKNTDWFTLAKGDNIFAFTADSGVTNLQFRVENKVIYEGV